MIYKNYINGVWLDSSTGNTFNNINPAKKNTYGDEFQDSDEVDINFAVEVAHNAFKMWKNTPAPKRGEIMFRAAEILVRDKECIARGMTQEMGKTLAETRGDVQESVDMSYYAAGEG
nr:aldehyde dehydrogenase family protein [Gammaproteobacteria bacterium]